MSEELLAARVEQLLTPTIEAMGFNVVRVSLSGGNNAVLQIMAEPLDGREMTVDHCADISRAVSAVLDVEDPIQSAYSLEVSSPGLDRPLVRLGDYDRFAGFDAKIEMKSLIDGRRKFRGRVDGTDGADVLIDIDGEQVRLEHAAIAKAKLIITDEMLAKLEEEKAHE
ncbi:ribosome maturation factor RimP [Thalassospiraceae bacterium LMO-JJ14]|nr:ribosome maturation factor RimP [Thalassospiraceae bacterium LMO-JJ14]